MQCVLMILNGEDMSKLLMTVIRFCITVEDHELKKLLVYFWECVKKYDASGHLKPEMILVWCVRLPCCCAPHVPLSIMLELKEIAAAVVGGLWVGRWVVSGLSWWCCVFWW
jgi:hypothetical protein